MDIRSDAHGGHRGRLRQRVLNEGFEGLEPHEVIEFLLYYAIPRQDVNALAHRLIDRFGSVEAVLGAEIGQLEAIDGVGGRTARWLALLGEAAAARAALAPEDRPSLANYTSVFHCAAQASRRVSAPAVMQLCLDGASRLIYRRVICPSLSWGEPETLRGALEDVLTLQARNVILLLFVDRSAPEPQIYDVSHARAYAHALHAAGSALLDVVVACGDELSSMRRQGMISDPDQSEALRMVREDYLSGMPGADPLRLTDFLQTDEPT